MYYSFRGQEPGPLPFRIRLKDGTTRTNPDTFTAEEIAEAGYLTCDPKPPYDGALQRCTWDSSKVAYVVSDIPQEELEAQQQEHRRQAWREIRLIRNDLLKNLDERVARYLSQTRLGITPVDNIVTLDTYAQALRDITLQSDNPDEIVWPDPV